MKEKGSHLLALKLKEYTFDLASFLEMKGVCVGMSKGMHPG